MEMARERSVDALPEPVHTVGESPSAIFEIAPVANVKRSIKYCLLFSMMINIHTRIDARSAKVKMSIATDPAFGTVV